MEQGAQLVQSSRVQSRSQEPVLQDSSSCTVSQPIPPFLAFVRIERVLIMMPPSHSLEHLDQPDHSDMRQSTGHFTCLHFFARSSCGHAMPYELGEATTSRVMVSRPPHAY